GRLGTGVAPGCANRRRRPAGAAAPFHEAHAKSLRDLGLRIEGTRLEPILAAFDCEVAAAGLASVRPRCYLADEWGVPFPSTSIGIPFYLARPDLTAYHAAKTGLVEGTTPAEIL